MSLEMNPSTLLSYNRKQTNKNQANSQPPSHLDSFTLNSNQNSEVTLVQSPFWRALLFPCHPTVHRACSVHMEAGSEAHSGLLFPDDFSVPYQYLAALTSLMGED